MHLSTSSSNDRLPTGNWILIWFGIGIVFFSSVLFMEFHIRHLGWRASVVDSAQLWVEQRQQASQLGKKGITLVGASRMQLDIDIDVMEKISGLTTTQLAIDGTSYIPVLESLANDPSITGTVLISVKADNMRPGKPSDTSTQWVHYYQTLGFRGLEPYRFVHNKISAWLNNRLVTRLEGAKPATVITSLAFKPAAGNYLVTYSNRSRDADYKKVEMPRFYANRVQRHFGETNVAPHATTYEEFIGTYEKSISTLTPHDAIDFSSHLKRLLTLVRKIENHGGNVILIRFPTDQLVWKIDNNRYPKSLFWDEIEKQHPKSIHFADHIKLSQYHLPDGSHLDFRDKQSFTKGLMDILIKKQLIPQT